MHEKIVGAADVVARQHGWQRAAVLPEPFDNLPRVPREAHCYQRLQRDAQGRRRHLGVISAQHTARLQTPHTRVRARLGQPNTRRQLLVG